MLNKRIISFKTINTPHNGKNIATLINDEIIDLGIRDKIFTIVRLEEFKFLEKG